METRTHAPSILDARRRQTRVTADGPNCCRIGTVFRPSFQFPCVDRRQSIRRYCPNYSYSYANIKSNRQIHLATQWVFFFLHSTRNRVPAVFFAAEEALFARASIAIDVEEYLCALTSALDHSHDWIRKIRARGGLSALTEGARASAWGAATPFREKARKPAR